MKKQILIKTFSIAISAVMIVFCVSLLIIFGLGDKSVKNELIDNTQIIASMINKSDWHIVENIDSTHNMRISIVSMDGEVLFDSGTTSSLENHFVNEREEIIGALNNTPQISKRKSASLKIGMYYYAIKCGTDANEIILRTAIPSSSVTAYVLYSLPILLAVIVLVSIFSFLIAKQISSRTANKFMQIGNSLKSINKGYYIPIDATSAEPELYDVMKETDDLCRRIDENYSDLQNEKLKLGFVINNMNQAIIALNSDNKILLINELATELLRIDTNAINMDLAYISNVKIYDTVLNLINSENSSTELLYNNKYLSFKDVEINSDDEIKRIIIISDLTKEKISEKQRSDFFYNASHELKTPLTALTGLGELLLQKTDKNSPAYKYAELMQKETNRINTLVLDMLKLSKLENANIVPECTDINVISIVNEIIAELDFNISKKNLTVNVEGDATIHIAPQHLYDVIANLLNNAINYNVENGQITIKVYQNNAQVSIQIIDTGIGIEAKHLPRLSERFYRVDKSHSKLSGGTGLGLAIVKHTVLLYNGTLTITSEPNIGTTVTVTFPIKQ